MKNKYGNHYNASEISVDYGQYIDINEYMSEYMSQYNGYKWSETKPSETEEERLAREKAEKRNSKIDQILG